MTVDIKRLNFYEGQFIRAADMRDWQAYLIDARRRHYVGHHTWGIVNGADLTQDPASKVWSVSRGMLVDGWGREIIVTDPEPLDVTKVAALLQGITGAATLQVWIAYQTEQSDRPPPGYTPCVTPIPFTRVRETFTLIYAPLLTPAVDESKPPAPFDDLEDDPTKAVWPIFLGLITWDTDPANPPAKTITGSSPIDSLNGIVRPFVGVVAEDVIAPGGVLTLRPAGPPTADTPEPGDFAIVRGALRVNGKLTAKDELKLRGRLSFENPAHLPTDPPMWLARRAPGSNTTPPAPGDELRLSLGNSPASTSRLSIGTGGGAETEIVNVTGDNKVNVPTGDVNVDTGSLSFGNLPRQMLNLWAKNYGVGVQDKALYFRTDFDFYWYSGGIHSSTNGDGGAGKPPQMQLDSSGNLFVRGDVFVGPTKIKIPGQKSDVIDIVTGVHDFPAPGVNGVGSISIDVQTTRLAHASDAVMFLSMTEIFNKDSANDARWQVIPSPGVRTNDNAFSFTVGYSVGDVDGYLVKLSYLVVFYP